MNEPFDRLIFSPAIHQTGEHSPKNIKPERSWINSTKLNQKFQNRVITGLRSSLSGECVTNKVIYDVTYLYNCQRCLERCAPSDWSSIASYLAIIDSREMIIAETGCLAFWLCFRESDKRSKRKLNFEEHIKCFWVWWNFLQKRDFNFFADAVITTIITKYTQCSLCLQNLQQSSKVPSQLYCNHYSPQAQ